jgi:hypothetical protein
VRSFEPFGKACNGEYFVFGLVVLYKVSYSSKKKKNLVFLYNLNCIEPDDYILKTKPTLELKDKQNSRIIR